MKETDITSNIFFDEHPVNLKCSIKIDGLYSKKHLILTSELSEMPVPLADNFTIRIQSFMLDEKLKERNIYFYHCKLVESSVVLSGRGDVYKYIYQFESYKDVNY